MRPTPSSETATPIELVRRLGPAALALLVISATALMGGATGAAPAALFSLALVAALILAALTTSSKSLGRALTENRVSLAALGLFLVWSLVTTLPVGGGWAHPMYAATGVKTGAISIAPFRTFEALAALVAPAAAFAIGSLAVERSTDRDLVARALLVAGLIFTAGALMQHVATGDDRLDGGLPSANAAATLFGVFLLVAVAVVLRAQRTGKGAAVGLSAIVRRALRAPFALGLIAVSLAGLFLTGSRGGALSCFAAIIVILALPAIGSSDRGFGARFSNLGKMALSIGVVVLLMSLAGAQMTVERMFQFGAEGGNRMTLYEAHWQAFLDRAWLGHGLGTFHMINELYATPENWNELRTVGAAHNVVLQFLEESGVIGAALFGVALGAPIVRAGSAALRDSSGRVWSALAVAATAMVFLHGMVDFGLNMPVIMALYGFILGAFSRRAVSKS